MSEMNTIHDLSGDPIYIRVCKKLREEILNGVFAADERLNTAELSQRYHVSRMPVREAIQHLRGEGLVVFDPYTGPRVRSIDLRFVENTYDLNAAIEIFLIGKIAPIVTEEQIRAAAAVNDEYASAIHQADWPRLIDLNMQFHSMLFQIADNPEALTCLMQRRDLINGLRRQFGYGEQRVTEAAKEHDRLLKALAAHDCAKAERIMRLHCEHAKENLIEHMKATMGYNEPKNGAAERANLTRASAPTL